MIEKTNAMLDEDESRRIIAFLNLALTTRDVTKLRNAVPWEMGHVAKVIKDALLELFFTPPAKPTALRTVASVTEDERARIHEERKREPLPPGWYFDGSRYISADFDGPLLLHPSIDAFVQDFVDKENEVIERHNLAIASKQ